MKETASLRKGLSFLRNISGFWGVRYSEGRKGSKLNRVRRSQPAQGPSFLVWNSQFSILDGKTAKQAGELQEVCMPELEAATFINLQLLEAATFISLKLKPSHKFLNMLHRRDTGSVFTEPRPQFVLNYSPVLQGCSSSWDREAADRGFSPPRLRWAAAWHWVKGRICTVRCSPHCPVCSYTALAHTAAQQPHYSSFFIRIILFSSIS